MNQNKLDQELSLRIQNQLFLNESSLKQYIECDAISKVAFVNCNFEKVDFSFIGTVFGSCSFQNCVFNHFFGRKVIFSNCHFENCKITNSTITKAEFYGIYFKNCNFLSVDLAASSFSKCKFKETRFFKSNLNFIVVSNSKVWKSEEWIEIDDFSNFDIDLDELVKRSYKIVFSVALVTGIFLLVNFINTI